MKKNLIWMFLLCFSLNIGHSQIFLGFKAGSTFSTYKKMDERDVEHYVTNYKPGFLGGAIFEIPFNSTFSAQIEAFYAQKGASITRHPREDDIKYICIHESLNYLDIPILLKTRLQGRPLGGYAAVGASVSYGFGGKRRFGRNNSEISEKITFGNRTDKDDYKPKELSVIAGAGLSYELGFGELVFDARFVGGRTQIGDIKSGYFNLKKIYHGDTRNQSIQLSLGLVFPLGG